jgi:PKD repeat protein
MAHAAAPQITSTSTTVGGAEVDLVMVNAVVTFSATATDADGDTLTYKWDFKDGSQIVEGPDKASVQHAFAKAMLLDQPYNVLLTVSDGTLSDVTTVPITVLAPNDGAAGVTNITQDNNITIQNPLNNLSVRTVNSNGGVLELLIDSSGLGAGPFDISTEFQEKPGLTLGNQVVAGYRPVAKFKERTIVKATVTASQAGQEVGQVKMTVPINALETGEFASGSVLKPNPAVITIKKIKGKMYFSGKNDSKLDKVDVSGSFVLPAGYDLAQNQEFWFSAGNVPDMSPIDPKGKMTSVSTEYHYASKVKLKYPRMPKDNKITTGNEDPVQFSFTLNINQLDIYGFATEGITNQLLPGEAGLKTVRRNLQIACVFSGTAYEVVAPVDFSFKSTAAGDAGMFATPKP